MGASSVSARPRGEEAPRRGGERRESLQTDVSIAASRSSGDGRSGLARVEGREGRLWGEGRGGDLAENNEGD